MTPAAITDPLPDPTIRAIDARVLPSHLRHGLTLTHFSLTGERPLPVVRIRGDRGSSGFGEAPPLPTFTGLDADATAAGVRDASEELRGMSATEALAHLHRPGAGLAPPVRCALDIALHDLRARARGVPLDAMLGPRRTPRVRISRAIGFHAPDTTARLALAYWVRGLQALKLKVGRAPELDAEVVHAVRRIVGPEVELAIDANGSLDAAGAVALTRACRTARLAYFEQPVPRGDMAGLRAVREAGLPVMADESAYDAADVEALAAEEAADLIAIKLIKTGGLAPALEVARAAAAHGLPVTLIDPLGSAISLHAGLALAATLADPGVAHGLSGGLDVDAPHAPHVALERGCLRPRSEPGLGIPVHWPETPDAPEPEVTA